MRARVHWPLALATLGSLASPGARAFADCAPARVSTCVDSDQLWPHPGPGPFFSLGSTTTTPAGQFSASLVTSYASRPIGLRVASADPAGTTFFAVEDAVDVTLLFAFGVTDRLELTVAAPMTVVQRGAGLAPYDGRDEDLTRSALRDVRLGFALSLFRPRADASGFGLAARFEFASPTASASAFAGSGTVTYAPTLVASYRLGRVLASAEAGARVRGVADFGSSRVGSAASAELGVAFDLLRKKLGTVALEAFALPSLVKQLPSEVDATDTASHASVPAEWIASVSSAPFVDGDVAFALGGGGPIPLATAAPFGEPRFRFDLAIRYAPTGRDTDGDGIPDARDKCPLEPEDFDGFQDADGCPDPDNDHDGIPDAVDKCPNQPEDFDGFEDADGCPDRDDPRRTKPKTPPAAKTTP